jgi:kumamolisin
MQPDALGPVNPDERVEVSLMLRSRRPVSDLEARLDRPMTREEFAASYGADPNDISRVEAFAQAHKLEVVEASQPRRTVRLAGRAADMSAAFAVSLQRMRLDDGTEYQSTDREVQVPSELSGAVEGIFGLDTRPIARPRE